MRRGKDMKNKFKHNNPILDQLRDLIRFDGRKEFTLAEIMSLINVLEFRDGFKIIGDKE